jgi:filamentous hemagglutinin
MGGSISVGWGKMSGSVNASKSNIDSNFNSVGQQSGIKAGSGGFQVSVAGNTALLGSVIASDTQAVNAQKNSFKTGGTLTIADIQNVASYSAKSISISMGSSQQPTGKMDLSGLGLGLAATGRCQQHQQRGYQRHCGQHGRQKHRCRGRAAEDL